MGSICEGKDKKCYKKNFEKWLKEPQIKKVVVKWKSGFGYPFTMNKITLLTFPPAHPNQGNQGISMT
jgi:hypothetical protein